MQNDRPIEDPKLQRALTDAELAAFRLCARIAPLLAGKSLAGHSDERGEAETARLREKVLSLWLEMVRRLVPENEAAIKRRKAT